VSRRALRLAAAFLRGRPVWCSWQVTRRCGSFCMFCEHRLEGGDRELDTAGCVRVAEGLSSWGALIVSLTGGEPFLRADLPEIVAAVAKHHFPLLTTHGWLVTPEKAREVWQAGLECATVRLHGPDAARHDGATGLPGSFERAMAAADVFTATRTRSAQRVNLKLRLDGGGADGVEPLLARAAARGVSVTVEPAFPVGEGLPRPLARELLALKARHGNFRSGKRYLARFDDALAKGVEGCQAGRAFVNVDHRGRVSKCVEFQGADDRVGDLVAEDATALSPALRRVAEANRCRSCWHASRGEVEAAYTTRGLLRALPELVRT
jgi:MoaA/NifB/PqqE/SkfB family radical SAM enzyme